MEFRELRQDEMLAASRTASVGFSMEYNEEEQRKRIEEQQPHRWGAVGDEGEIQAVMRLFHFKMHFDGHVVPVGGIASVASLPEHRRGGNIRKLFEKVFDYMIENGYVFSHLYPFSHQYYNKFGYELCGMTHTYKLTPASARMIEADGCIVEFLNEEPAGSDMQAMAVAIKAVYEAYAKKYNMMLSRDDLRWKNILNVTKKSLERIYCWKDEAGTIKGWVKLRSDGVLLTVIDYAWVDQAAMLGVLNFLGQFDGAVEKMQITADEDFVPELFWGKIYGIESTRKYLGMNRIVDAKKALELMKKPDEAGKVVIKINDCFAQWNNKTYELSYDNQESTVRETNASPDLEVSERALAQLILGFMPLDKLTVRKDVQVYNQAPLTSLFVKKKTYIADYF